MKRRADKIKLLREIMQGKKKIYELSPRKTIAFRKEGSDYHCMKLNKTFTEQEFRAYQKLNPHFIYIVITRKIITNLDEYAETKD